MDRSGIRGDRADLLIVGARLVATLDADDRELRGGWVAIRDGLVAGVGTGPPPDADEALDAADCLVTPGLINTHHHLYQNLTRAHPAATNQPLFGWLRSLYPVWRHLDTEGAYLSAWVGLAELALAGCTTSSDHLYVHPRGTGDLLSASIDAAHDLGIRFHTTHGSMSLSRKDGGLPPDDVVLDDDEILAAAEDAVRRHHDPAHGAMTRIAIAPCSPFSVTEELMRRAAELAERLDVRLHTHFAENAEDDEYHVTAFGCRPIDYLDRLGWCTDRTWVAHCVTPTADEIVRLGAAGVGVAHCPSSNLILASGISPIVPLRAGGCVPVGLGVDGSSSADAGVALARGAAGDAPREVARRCGPRRRPPGWCSRSPPVGGAGCLGRVGEIGDAECRARWATSPCGRSPGPSFAGAVADPIEAWLRCADRVTARHTVVHGTAGGAGRCDRVGSCSTSILARARSVAHADVQQPRGVTNPWIDVR